MNRCFTTLKFTQKQVSFLHPSSFTAGINFSLMSATFYLLNFSGLTPQVQAQIIPDTTLPVNSIVTPSGSTRIIEGGTQAGGNLFHSFQEFSVSTNTEAFFNNGLDIQNIFTRVTGNSISNIDGLIRANGVANLFLLNPNGIIFGPNAKLNIGGSFLASTANSFKFADGTEFNAKNPQATPLLTVSVPVGLQYGVNAGDITIQGEGQNFGTNGINGSFSENLNPLEVNSGNTLAFVGGNVIIDGGILQAPGGRVELGGLAGEGTVEINIDNNAIASLKFPDGVERSDILITNKAGINTNAFGGGSITIAARNIDILAKSVLTTGIRSGASELIDTQAGDIDLNATGAIAINASRIDNIVSAKATGNTGNINIKANSLSVVNNATLSNSIFGEGEGGNINIDVRKTINFDNSIIFSNLAKDGKGNSGAIVINTGSLFAQNNSQFQTLTRGEGNAGKITINATDTVSFEKSSAFSTVEPGAVGDASGILISTNSLFLKNGATLQTLIRKANLENGLPPGEGNAGFVSIQAKDFVSIVGDPNGQYSTGIFSSVGQEAIGNSGEIIINAKNISLTENASLTTDNQGSGVSGNIRVSGSNQIYLENSSIISTSNNEITDNYGNITITAETGSIRFLNNAKLNTSNTGSGYAGSIIISASGEISIANSDISSEGNNGFIYIGKLAVYDREILPRSVNLNHSYIATNNQAIKGYEDKKINAGKIFINAIDRITLENDSSIEAFTDRLGNGGEINLQTANGRIILDNSTIASSVEPKGIGSGGSITIQSQSINLVNGTVLDAGVLGQGNAGNIFLNVAGVVDIAGEETTIFSDVGSESSGNAGSITIQASEVFLRDGAFLYSNNDGKGNAGNITVTSLTTRLNNNSFIGSESTSGNGGDINLSSENLLLLRGASDISTSAGTERLGGNGGNITIRTNNLVALENSNIIANAFSGKGGQVTIDTKGIFGAQTRTREELENLAPDIEINDAVKNVILSSDITAISQQGDPELQGTVEISTPDVDPSAGLIELPQTVVDATKLSASSCRRSKQEQKNQFIVTGRGGLPPNPNEALNDEATWMDLRARGGERQIRSSVPSSGFTLSNPQIMEAQGWKVNSQGQIELLAQTATVTPQTSGITPLQCPAP